MSQVKPTIFEVVVKGYHECYFDVSVGENYIVRRKRGDRRPVLKVPDQNDRGQLGHQLAMRTGKFRNRTHRKVPVRLCSIEEPIEKQSND